MTALPLDLPADQPHPTAASGKLTTAEVMDLLRKRYVLAPEVRNQAGFGGYGGDGRLRSADLIVCDTWQSGPVRLIGHEVKVSRSDWLRELKDPSKAAAFTPYLAEWWIVVGDRKIVRDGELPDGWGLLAPAGDMLRAVVKARRNAQPDNLPTGMIAALLRSVQAVGRADLERERSKPFTARNVPFLPVFDHPPSAWREPERARSSEVKYMPLLDYRRTWRA